MVMYRNLTAGVYQIILHAHRAYTILNALNTCMLSIASGIICILVTRMYVTKYLKIL